MPRVLKDEIAIGKMAADYFIARGFRYFSFHQYHHSPTEAPSNHLRYVSFRGALEAEGNTFHDLDVGDLVEKLQEAPKPLAVMAENDDDALRALEACQVAGVRVPEEVAILGVDNNPDFCDLASTPLSSIDSNCQRVGYEAARLLDRLMDGEPPPENPILIPPKEVVTRQSTDILAVTHLPSAMALKRLMSEYRDPLLDLDHVARGAGISRRNLEIAFKRHLGYTTFDYLERLRTDAALAMLDESNYKGYEIADNCGFSNLDHLSRVLKKRFGKSYRQMRPKTT